MEVKIGGFIKHSTIYAIGSILSKVGIFLMIPVYTRYLTPADYGTLELLYVTAAVLRMFLSMDIAHATLRFFFEYEDVLDRKRVISTALISSGLLGLACVGVFFQFTESLSLFFFNTEAYSDLFRLVSIMFLLELSMEISTAYIRAAEQSLFYISVSLGQLLIRIGLNSYALSVLNYGMRGILIGDLIATFLAWIALTGMTLKFAGFNFHLPKLKELLLYSYPLALGSIGGLVINNADRYFLKTFSTLETVGLYALAYRMGAALQALYTEPFMKSYGPFRFSIMKQENAGKIYSRMLTYFLCGFLFLGLGMVVLGKEIIQLMTAPSFWKAASVLPWVVLASSGAGCYYVLQIGIYLQKQTKAVPFILLATALVNLVANGILVPSLGIYGAGIASVVTNITLCLLGYFISQKFYPIQYEFRRILKLFVLTCAMYGTSLFITPPTLIMAVVLKTIFVLLFPFILYGIHFFHQDEIEAMWDGWKRFRFFMAGKLQLGKV